MALADPQTITVNAVPQTLNKVVVEPKKTVYATADESYRFTVSHQESKDRTRRMVRVDHRVVATDPLSSVNEWKSLGVYIVIDEPEYGFDDTLIGNVAAGLMAWANSTNVGKVLSGQH